MTDKEKLLAIKAEIERLKIIDYPCDNYEQEVGYHSALDDVQTFINSLPEEPHQELYNKLSKMATDALTKETKESWNKFLDEPVSEDLDWAAKWYTIKHPNIPCDIIDKVIPFFKAGAQWGKNQAKVEIQAQSMALAHGCPKEPVGEELEEAAEKASINAFFVSPQWTTVGKELFKAGAEWQKAKDESVTQDLGEYINELSKQFPEVSFAKLSRISVRVAKWQIAKLMKDSTDVTVHIDASNYPYIPQIELYDYDKDVPLAKEGDRVKIVIIKED